MMRWKRNKYGATKFVSVGYTFDSKAEAKRYGELVLLQKAGEIAGLIVHPEFVIEINGIKICKAILDFYYWRSNRPPHKVYEDVKGRDNALSRLKRKLVEAQYGIKVTVIPAYGTGRK